MKFYFHCQIWSDPYYRT